MAILRDADASRLHLREGDFTRIKYGYTAGLTC